jgi:sigma-E factor negative regulatory protein RseC
LCASSDAKEKLITVGDAPQGIRRGDEVVIVGQTSVGLKAVLYAFVLPFVLLLATLFIAMPLSGDNQLTAGLSALLVLAPYYLILYLLRHRLAKALTFHLRLSN